jgi:hypothetical protein
MFSSVTTRTGCFLLTLFFESGVDYLYGQKQNLSIKNTMFLAHKTFFLIKVLINKDLKSDLFPENLHHFYKVKP